MNASICFEMSGAKPVYASPETSDKLSGNSTSPTSLNLSSTDNSREVTSSPPLPKKQYEDETFTTYLQQLRMKLQEEKVELGQKRMREEEECDDIDVDAKKLRPYESDESDEDYEYEYSAYDQQQQEARDRFHAAHGYQADRSPEDDEGEGDYDDDSK